MYRLPHLEVTGNFPVRSEWMVCVSSPGTSCMAANMKSVGALSSSCTGCGSLLLIVGGCCGWAVATDFVDLWFFLVWSRCPCAVAIDFGKYFCAASAVNPGHVAKCPRLIACIHVLGVGLKAAAWRNRMCSAVVSGNMLLISNGCGAASWALAGCSSKCVIHNPGGVRCPVNIILLLLLWTSTSLAVNVTVHPASQNWPPESNDCCSCGNISAWHAAVGRSGTLMVSVCVDIM